MDNALPRADLHCHSSASNKTGEAMLNAIACPESYSRPQDVYAQALRRGMRFVTITDHDTIRGVEQIRDMPDVLVGEEVTVRFPEDGCKIHLLVYGHTADQHEHLQAIADDVYAVARYLLDENLAHSVAHPIYRQNDMLERWHVERLLLLFKSFECLNGAHAPSHREAFEPLLAKLDAREIERLSKVHGLDPLWPEPHVKGRTAGSDDHGQLNIGRTWTEFPQDVASVGDVLDALRAGRCAPGGEAGSVAKLAHQFYGVAVRYYMNERLGRRGSVPVTTQMLRAVAGDAPVPGKAALAGAFLKSRAKRLNPFRRRRKATGVEVLKSAFLKSVLKRAQEHPELWDAAKQGLPPLGEHEQFFGLVNDVNRDVTRELVDEMASSFKGGKFAGLFEGIGAVAGQQFILAPYYFALFHQNKERRLLGQITRQTRPVTAENLRVGLFTDTFDEVNGVGRFLRDMAAQADRAGRRFTVHTSTTKPRFDLPNRRNFEPLLSHPMPMYEQIDACLPPVLEVLEFCDRQQYDAIHISTPGPMGLVGYLAAKMLRAPVLATYHTDFPAYLHDLTRGDHRVVNNTRKYMTWLYTHAERVFSRSGAYHFNLRSLGVPQEKLATIRPGIDTRRFRPDHDGGPLWQTLAHADKPRRLLYVGRVSVEKNLPLLAEAFETLCRTRNDVRLVIAGDGPYRAEMEKRLAGLPATFLGEAGDDVLGRLYAGAELFVFPSRTDTLGQVVMEAQASGLPCLVSETGGPRETVADGETGRVIPATDPGVWARAIADLLDDTDALRRMADNAAARREDWDLSRTFDAFWREHLAAAAESEATDAELVAAE